MIEFILNGKSVKVAPENISAFLKSNPDARPKDVRGFDPHEYDYVKKIKEKQEQQEQEPEMPGKSQEASQPQINQTTDTESSSEDISSDFVKYNLNNKRIFILGAGGVVSSIIFSLNKMNKRTYKIDIKDYNLLDMSI